MGDKVEIGKTVDYKTLETALIKAADEVGWKVQVEDKFCRNYQLGSVQEKQVYGHTMIHLRGRIFSAIKIYLVDRDSSDHFFIWQGIPHGVASEKRIKKYLNAVSRNL